MSAITALRRMTQEGYYELEDGQGYELRPCLKKKKVKETKPQRVWTGDRPLNSEKHALGTGVRQKETRASPARALGAWAGVATEEGALG